MSDNQSLDPDEQAQSSPPADPVVAPSPPPPKKSFGRRHWGKLTLLLFLAVPLAGLALWTIIGLNWTYASGQRAGYLQKISRKGWICKTWEGELAISNVPGSAPQIFQYSVRSDSVAHAIEALSGQPITISYSQHKGVPTKCFGETNYFVNGVRKAGGG